MGNKKMLPSRWLTLVPALVLCGCSSMGLGNKPSAEAEPQATVEPLVAATATASAPANDAPVAMAPAVDPKQAEATVSAPAAMPVMSVAGDTQAWLPVFDPVVPLVQNMLAQMELNNMEVNGATPIAVSSFVDLGTLGRTDALGRQLAESFSHELHQGGFTVVEYKATGTIKVTGKGDFALSRDLNDLEKSQSVDYVLTGTISQQYNGLMINARMVNLRTKLVAASAQGFIPAQIMQQMMSQGRMYRAREGMLIRETGLSLRPISLR